MKKKIIILGADGYLGWASCMYFSFHGYEVFGLDNMSKRRIVKSLKIKTLFNNPSFKYRCKIWNQNSNSKIKSYNCDIKNLGSFKKILSKIKNPTAIIHFAEQPSAPYSMMSSKSSNFTIYNNLITTNNLINAIKDLNIDTHIIKLGTMGEYGTPNIDIEEGWITINHKGRKDKFLFPRQAGSIYHTTKIMDTDLLWLATRIWKLRVTDLMQGPVYGIDTEQTIKLKKLRPAFHYDEIFGTVLNRFVTQACVNFPLTVYGKGGQKRGYININDSLKCIHAAIKNPPQKGKMNIYNQITETFSVNQLALMVMKAAGSLGINVKIKKIKNPRKEMENHYYNPKYSNLRKIGVKRSKINNNYLMNFIKEVFLYKQLIDKKNFIKNIKW